MNPTKKFGVFLPFYAFQTKKAPEIFDQLKTIVLEAERLGYDSVWLDDHLMYGDWPILECWTTLSALAICTSKIRLGTLVTCDAHRNPALLAKTAATLDVLSNGRLEFGIGAGCQEKEHTAYGFRFPNVRSRVERMQESLEIIKRLWTQEKASFSGSYYSLKEAVCKPKPIQKPYPPITIGGAGEKYTLRVTARYADRVDFGFLSTPEEYKHKLEVLKNHCKGLGRAFRDIELSCWPSGQVLIAKDQESISSVISSMKPSGMPLEEFRKETFIGTPQECLSHLQPYVDAGFTYFMLYFGDLPSTKSLELFANAVANRLR